MMDVWCCLESNFRNSEGSRSSNWNLEVSRIYNKWERFTQYKIRISPQQVRAMRLIFEVMSYDEALKIAVNQLRGNFRDNTLSKLLLT